MKVAPAALVRDFELISAFTISVLSISSIPVKHKNGESAQSAKKMVMVPKKRHKMSKTKILPFSAYHSGNKRSPPLPTQQWKPGSLAAPDQITHNFISHIGRYLYTKGIKQGIYCKEMA